MQQLFLACDCLLQILIGNAYYNCSCVRYISTNFWLTFGLSAGSGLIGIIIIIVITVAVCRRCRKKPKKRAEERERTEERASNNYVYNAEPIELYEEDKYYSTIDPPVVAAAAAAASNDNANEYCRPLPAEPEGNKEYSHLGPPQPEPAAAANSPYYLSLKTDDTC